MMSHNIENYLFKSTEMLVSVLKAGVTSDKGSLGLVNIIDNQMSTIAELRRELQCVRNELGSKVNKDTMQAVYSGTNTLVNEDGSIKKVF